MRPTTNLLLFLCCATFLVGNSATAERRAAAAADELPTCPAKYPTAQLLTAACKRRAPAWCKRQLAAGRSIGRAWRRRCHSECRQRLRLGARIYPVAWAATKAKLSTFGLGLPGAWRRRSLTIWRGRVFARRGRGRWQVVYQLGGGRLVTADPAAKPPCRPARQRRAARTKKAAASSLRVRCRGNECRVRLSLRALMHQAARLLRGSRSRSRHRRRDVELRLRLAVIGSRRRSRARFVSGRLALVDKLKPQRSGRTEADTGAVAYRHFVDKRRKRYWRKEGWRIDDKGEADARKAKKGRRRDGRRRRRSDDEGARETDARPARKAHRRGGKRLRRGDVDGEDRRRGRKSLKRDEERKSRRSRGDRRRRGGRQYKPVGAFRDSRRHGNHGGSKQPRSIGLFDFKDD